MEFFILLFSSICATMVFLCYSFYPKRAGYNEHHEDVPEAPKELPKEWWEDPKHNIAPTALEEAKKFETLSEFACYLREMSPFRVLDSYYHSSPEYLILNHRKGFCVEYSRFMAAKAITHDGLVANIEVSEPVITICKAMESQPENFSESRNEQDDELLEIHYTKNDSKVLICINRFKVLSNWYNPCFTSTENLVIDFYVNKWRHAKAELAKKADREALKKFFEVE